MAFPANEMSDMQDQKWEEFISGDQWSEADIKSRDKNLMESINMLLEYRPTPAEPRTP